MYVDPVMQTKWRYSIAPGVIVGPAHALWELHYMSGRRSIMMLIDDPHCKANELYRMARIKIWSSNFPDETFPDGKGRSSCRMLREIDTPNTQIIAGTSPHFHDEEWLANMWTYLETLTSFQAALRSLFLSSALTAIAHTWARILRHTAQSATIGHTPQN